MSNRTDLDLSKLYPYIFSHSVRESPLLESLRQETAQDEMARMQIAPEQGQLMTLLLKLMGARRVIEIGTYTGYSSICMAMALPENGKVICCDTSEYWTAIARKYWQKSGQEKKIELHLAPAAETLEMLLNENTGVFDAAFIDADKEQYDVYYEQCLRLLRPGGLIMIDNVLWNGKVAEESGNDADTRAIQQLNDKLVRDDRIDLSLLPIADGLTLARKR